MSRKFSNWSWQMVKAEGVNGGMGEFVKRAIEYVKTVACPGCSDKIEKGLVSHMLSPRTSKHPSDPGTAGGNSKY